MKIRSWEELEQVTDGEVLRFDVGPTGKLISLTGVADGPVGVYLHRADDEPKLIAVVRDNFDLSFSLREGSTFLSFRFYDEAETVFVRDLGARTHIVEKAGGEVLARMVPRKSRNLLLEQILHAQRVNEARREELFASQINALRAELSAKEEGQADGQTTATASIEDDAETVVSDDAQS